MPTSHMWVRLGLWTQHLLWRRCQCGFVVGNLLGRVFFVPIVGFRHECSSGGRRHSNSSCPKCGLSYCPFLQTTIKYTGGKSQLQLSAHFQKKNMYTYSGVSPRNSSHGRKKLICTLQLHMFKTTSTFAKSQISTEEKNHINDSS